MKYRYQPCVRPSSSTVEPATSTAEDRQGTDSRAWPGGRQPDQGRKHRDEPGLLGEEGEEGDRADGGPGPHALGAMPEQDRNERQRQEQRVLPADVEPPAGQPVGRREQATGDERRPRDRR